MVEQENNHHYVLIKDLSKLVGCQYNKHKAKKQLCHHCLRGFQSIDALNEHIEHGCLASEGQSTNAEKR